MRLMIYKNLPPFHLRGTYGLLSLIAFYVITYFFYFLKETFQREILTDKTVYACLVI